jgi:hypothetical protein
MLVVERNKAFPIPISEKVEAYHHDELRKLWISDTLRNWELFSKKVMDTSF